MFLPKLKTTIAMLLVAVIAVTGTVAAGLSARGDDKPQPAKKNQPASQEEKPPQAPQQASDSAKLLKARLDAAKEAYKGAWEILGTVKRVGGVLFPVCDPEEVYTWSVRWLNAQSEMTDKRDDNIAALEEHIKRMKELQKRVDAMTPTLLSKWLNSAASWYLVEAEILQAQEKAHQKADAGVPTALLKARLDAAKEAYKGAWENLETVKKIGENERIPEGRPEEVYTWSVRWLNAQRDMNDKRDDHIVAAEEHINRMKELQKKVTALTPDVFPNWFNTAALWYLAEAEILQAQEKAHQKADAGVPMALLKARLDAAKDTSTIASEGFGFIRRPTAALSSIMQKRFYVEADPWSVRWLNAQLDMNNKRSDHIAALEEQIKRMKELQRKVDAMTPTYLPEWSNPAMAWYLAEAEIWLAKEKAK